jgi:DNA polymerase-3 subunit delta
VSALALAALRKELGAGRVRPAYLLAGEEPLLRDDALALLREHLLAGAPEDFNFDRLDGETTTAARLSEAVCTLPVMAQRRLVVLREPEPRRRGSRGGRAAAGELAASLPAVLEDLAGQETTVLAVTAERIDRRARWVKAFEEPAAIVSCEPPKPGRALVAFVREEARRQGIGLEAGAAELLADRVGPQLLALRNEIAKAGLVAGPDTPVTRDAAAAATSDLAEQPVWDLTDAIGEGRPARALEVLGRVLAGGVAAPVVLGALASHFRKLARLRSGGRVAAPPFVARKLEAQARRYAPARLVACLRAIHDADVALKGASPLPPGLALERLVLGLAS